MSLFEHDDFAEQMAKTGLSASELSRQRVLERRKSQAFDLAATLERRKNQARKQRVELNKQLSQIAHQRRAEEEAFSQSYAREQWRESWRRMVRIAHQRQMDGLDDESLLWRRRPLMRDIAREVCEKYRISKAEFISHRRQKTLVQARQEFYWRARQETTKSFPEIGRYCGDRDHTTVLYGARNYERMMRVKAKLEPAREAKKPGNGDQAVVWDLILDMGASA